MLRRGWLVALVAALAMLAVPAVANAGQSFLFLQPGFTQSVFGATSQTFLLGGVAFAPDNDPWVADCGADNSPLHRFDGASTVVVNGTTIHPETIGPSTSGCGLTNGLDGNLYSNTSSGVRRLDPNTGAQIGGPFGPPGDALGIAPDPLTGDLVYVGSTGTILKVDQALTTTSTFSNATTGDFIDGIAFSPDGQFLFASNRIPTTNLTILDRNGNVVQQVLMPNEPDGIAFHAATPKFVVTDNTDGTMTRFDFPADDYTQVPVQSAFAAGGFRGDLSQVGADGCLYLTQAGTRYDNGVVTGENSLVQICGGFAPPRPADLSITKAGPAFAQSGGTVTYDITVHNGGPSDAAGVVVSDPLPAGETLVSATPSQGSCSGTVTCNLGTILNGGSATIEIVVNLTAACGSSVTNTATVSSDTADPDTSNNTASTTAVVYCATTGGNFVIGDRNAAIGTAVTFWGAQWWKLNSLSGGAAPAAFKGFETTPSVAACGTNWTTGPGNSPPPPAPPLPSLMAVIVSSSITKSGPTISGNTAQIVLVQTGPGYDANPGHAGTGTVVARLC